MRPLANWANLDSIHPDLIWWSRLDGKWQCEVQRRDEREAMLVIFDRSTSAAVHQEIMSLSYGAMFGPDVADVDFWQRRCAEIVDSLGEKND